MPPTFSDACWNLHTAQQICIANFQSSRSPTFRYPSERPHRTRSPGPLASSVREDAPARPAVILVPDVHVAERKERNMSRPEWLLQAAFERAIRLGQHEGQSR
jgi:hypothetical protein